MEYIRHSISDLREARLKSNIMSTLYLRTTLPRGLTEDKDQG